MRSVDPDIYDIPYDKIASGYYSAVYFNRGARILEDFCMQSPVTMQIFQKQQAIVCGLDESIAVLKRCANNWPSLTVRALRDGDRAEPWETVMTIEGPLKDFMHLESVYLGILRDSTTVATNMNRLVFAADSKPVVYLADRFNRFSNQESQGYAAVVGGAAAVCTDAMTQIAGGEPIGTMAHALIAAFGGDVVAASKAFAATYPDVKLISLVDFNNDCVTDALAVARALGDKLWGVRLDTSEKMVDESMLKDGGSIKQEDKQWTVHQYRGFRYNDFPPDSEIKQYENNTMHGVNPRLVYNVREALDAFGFGRVKIVVSGGFDVEKISRFKDLNVPVDMYGVGSSVLKGGSDFTADVVWPVGKKGREYNHNDRLEIVR